MRIETISFVKKHASDLPVDEPMLVTQNGVPAYVIEDYAQRKFRDEAIALLKLTSFAEQDIQAGQLVGNASLKQRLGDRINAIDE